LVASPPKRPHSRRCSSPYSSARRSRSVRRIVFSKGIETDMKYNHTLNQIRSQTSQFWDKDGTRTAVRQAFRKASQCHTPELGAEIYASENQELILYHTCKSRACP